MDIKKFIRKLQLQLFFQNSYSKKEENNNPIVCASGEFIPPDTQEPLARSIVTQLKHIAATLHKRPWKRSTNNISRDQRTALTQLQNNTDIIIQKADKGGGIIILNKSDYINSITKYLENSKIHKKLNKNPCATVFSKIKTLTSNYKNCWDKYKKEKAYIMQDNRKLANFYALPKIHKSEKIQQIVNTSSGSYVEITEPVDLTFRYINAECFTQTSNLCELLEKLLKWLLEKIPSFLKDTPDFLRKIPTFSRAELDDIIIVTVDVVNMYYSIKKTLGMRAMRYWLHKYSSELPKRFSIDFIIDAINLVLESSNFTFNSEYYTLTDGTVMGTKLSPIYANLTMGFLEVQLYDKVGEKYGEDVKKYVIKNWKRFLDDGQIMWKKSFGPIEDFIDILNTLDSSLKFTFEASETGLPYLNTFIFKNNGKLQTDIYYKKTDSHDYLPFHSSHPRHTKTNIPGTLARTICTIIEDPTLRKYRLNELKLWLLRKKYPIDLINTQFLKFSEKESLELRETVVRDKDELLVFVQTYNPKNPNIFGKIRESFEFLKDSEKYSKTFSKTKLIKSEKQPKNLGSLLRNSKISSSVTTYTPGVKKCGRSNCGTCAHILEDISTYFHRADVNHRIMSTFTCKSCNLIYKITCLGCGEYYIGETVHLQHRVSNHKTDIKHEIYREQKVHQHIFECAKNLEVKFTIIPFYQVYEKSRITRKAVEDYFIRKYKPLLNDED